jgi:hypothetical protein
MTGFEMLDIAIGMIFIFLLLSLVCSALNEIVESMIKMRAVDLERGIRELLRDDKGTDLVKKIYDHPLVYTLFKGDYDPAKLKPVKKGAEELRYASNSNLPSYIPARNFALALMDVVFPATPTQPGGASGAIGPQKNSGAAQGGFYSPPQSPPQAFVTANPLQQLRLHAGNLENPKVQQALLTMIDAAGNDAAKARENIENWYNSGMDRVSGWYKRRVQQIVFWMGFFVAVIVNVDTFAVFSNLTNDRPLRNSIVASAQRLAESNKESTTVMGSSVGQIQQNVDTLLKFGLPVGWKWKSSLNQNPKAITNLAAIPAFSTGTNEQIAFSVIAWLLKLCGWLVTALAISLGAPFWFDTLNKIMVVRSTVKPAEKSPEEGSEDRQNKS